MKTLGIIVTGLILGLAGTAHAGDDSEGNLYLGLGIGSMALDSDRIPGTPSRSPGHTPKIGSLILGYQLNDRWAADITFGTDLSDNIDTDLVTINGYRFFGDHAWKPYLTAGISNFGIDDAADDSTNHIQAGFGLSRDLTDKLEFRIGYQHFYEPGGAPYNDDAIMLAFNWHFRKPVAAAPVAQPESVPVKKEVVDTFELQVQFDFDKSDIKSVFQPQFDEIAKVLKESPEISMTIEGHTCSIGTEKYNQGLSERRSAAVKQKFVEEFGIPAERINAEGYGESRPVADNATLAGRQKNRRAIAVILRPRMVTE